MIHLSDEQWDRIREHFPEENIPEGRPGRKPVPTRRVLEAVLWILNTGAQWHMLPQSYPNYKTVHRRFQQWCREEVLRNVLTDLANTLREQGQIDEEECFIDAMFSSAKGGGEQIGPTKRGKGVKIMGIVDRHGLPLAVSTHAANHHEVTLVQLSFDFYMCRSEAGESDQRQGVRQRRAGCAAERGRCGDDRAASQGPKEEENAGRSTTASLRETLARRAVLCVASVATPSPGAMGILRSQLSRFRAARFHRHTATAILR
jgi:transposase